MKKVKQALCVLLTCALLLGALGTTMSFAAKIDTSKAEKINMIIPKLVSPAGKDFLIVSGSDLYAFTAPRDGNFRVISNSLGVYPNYQKWADVFGNFSGSDVLFKVLTALVDTPYYFLNFIVTVLMDKYFPETNPSVQVLDGNGKVLATGDTEGFALFKSNRNDYRIVVPLEKGKTYYLLVATTSTTLDLPYFFGVMPWF